MTGKIATSLRWLACLLGLFQLAAFACDAASVQYYADRVTPLIEPAKLPTLGVRGANPRIQKVVALLAMAHRDSVKPSDVLDLAIRSGGMTNKLAAELTKTALLRNLDIARKLGCLDTNGLAEMRKGKSPTIKKGPYTGDELSVDHIIPRAVCPELDNVIANLELMPLRANERKNARVGDRQIALAEKLHAAGLLTSGSLRELQQAATK